MAKITVLVGILLVALGAYFYFTAQVAEGEAPSPTALIPAFFGAPVLILGLIGMSGGEAARKHTAHIAVMITLLGALGGFGMGIPKALGAEGELPRSVIAQLIMGGICLVHVGLSVRSFIAARKARQGVS